MEEIAAKVASLVARTGMKCNEFAAKFHINEIELAAWLDGKFEPSTMKLFCIERIVDLVEQYGEGQYKWIECCRTTLAGP